MVHVGKYCIHGADGFEKNIGRCPKQGISGDYLRGKPFRPFGTLSFYQVPHGSKVWRFDGSGGIPRGSSSAHLLSQTVHKTELQFGSKLSDQAMAPRSVSRPGYPLPFCRRWWRPVQTQPGCSHVCNCIFPFSADSDMDERSSTSSRCHERVLLDLTPYAPGYRPGFFLMMGSSRVFLEPRCPLSILRAFRPHAQTSTRLLQVFTAWPPPSHNDSART